MLTAYDTNFSKEMYLYLQNNALKTDEGLIFEDIKTEKFLSLNSV